MGFGDYHYQIRVVSQASMDGVSSSGDLTSGCLVRVYDAGTRTNSTIYSNNARASKTNAITRTQFATDGQIDFWSPSSSHDISVAYSDGSVQRFSGVTPQTRTVVLNTSSVMKLMVAPFGSATTETDLSLDFPLGSHILDAYIEVTAIDATEDIDVGLLSTESGGDADGLLDGISVGTLGFVSPMTFTAGSNETYLSAETYGVLMGTFLAGADVVGDSGTYWRAGHFVTAAVSLCYTASAGSDTGTGYIYVPFRSGL